MIEQLKVGSVWECVIECVTKMDMHYFNWEIGDKCKLLAVNNFNVRIMHNERGWGNSDNINHFLACFKPIEKGGQ